MAKATPALEITTTEAPSPKPRKRGGKPVAIEEHTVVTKWAEEKKVGALPPKARKTSPAEDFENEDDADDIDVELPEDVRAVLSEYDSASGLVMEINRLPHYHLNGKQDPASLVCCGDRDFDPQEYKNVLRLYYAKEGVPNFFIIKLKSPDRKWIPGGRIGPINVEAATPDEKARHGIYIAPEVPNVVATINHATPPYPYAALAPQEPIDRMAGIRETVSLLKEFQEIGLIPKLERAKPEQSIQQNPQQLSEEDILVRAALSSPEARERVSNGLLGKLLGEGALAAAKEEAPYWFEPAFSVVTNLIQGLTPGINSLLQVTAQARAMELQRAAQPQAAPASLPEGIQGQQPPPNFQPEQSVPQQEPSPEPMQQPQPEDILFAQIFMSCQRRKLVKPEVCAKGVLDLVDAHSAENGYSPFTNAVDIFLSADVADIVTFAATQNPIAAKMASEPDVLPWLKAVQDEIRKEWQNDGEDNQTN